MINSSKLSSILNVINITIIKIKNTFIYFSDINPIEIKFKFKLYNNLKRNLCHTQQKKIKKMALKA
jgi:hypothetical protein